MTGKEWETYAAIVKGNRTSEDLMKVMKVKNQSNVSRYIDTLEEEGLIAHVQGKDKRRKFFQVVEWWQDWEKFVDVEEGYVRASIGAPIWTSIDMYEKWLDIIKSDTFGEKDRDAIRKILADSWRLEVSSYLYYSRVGGKYKSMSILFFKEEILISIISHLRDVLVAAACFRHLKGLGLEWKDMNALYHYYLILQRWTYLSDNVAVAYRCKTLENISSEGKFTEALYGLSSQALDNVWEYEKERMGEVWIRFDILQTLIRYGGKEAIEELMRTTGLNNVVPKP